MNNSTPQKRQLLASGMAIAGFLGVLDTGWLTYKHFTGSELTCSILNGCEQLLNSDFAVIFGIPLALIGLIYYLTLTSSAIMLVIKHQKIVSQTHLGIVSLGVIASGVLIYIQGAIIGAWCQYCLVSAAITSTIWVLSLSYQLTKDNHE